MVVEAAERAFIEIVEGNWPVQITRREDGDWTFDFASRLHAEVLHETLQAEGFTVEFEPKPYYARVA